MRLEVFMYFYPLDAVHKRDIRCQKVCVCQSVLPSVLHDPALNALTYRRKSFTNW